MSFVNDFGKVLNVSCSLLYASLFVLFPIEKRMNKSNLSLIETIEKKTLVFVGNIRMSALKNISFIIFTEVCKLPALLIQQKI